MAGRSARWERPMPPKLQFRTKINPEGFLASRPRVPWSLIESFGRTVRVNIVSDGYGVMRRPEASRPRGISDAPVRRRHDALDLVIHQPVPRGKSDEAFRRTRTNLRTQFRSKHSLVIFQKAKGVFRRIVIRKRN